MQGVGAAEQNQPHGQQQEVHGQAGVARETSGTSDKGSEPLTVALLSSARRGFLATWQAVTGPLLFTTITVY